MRALIGIFTASVLLVSGPVLAKDVGWYTGLGMTYTDFKVNAGALGTAKDKTPGFLVLGGYQISPHIAFEGELAYSGEAKDSINGTNVKVNYNSWTVGIVGNLPIGDVFDVFAKFGATYGQGEYTIGDVKTTARDGGYTAGAGAGMHFGAVDLRLRYEVQRVRFDNRDVVDNPTRLGLDVLFRF